jgi:hypothetical protein
MLRRRSMAWLLVSALALGARAARAEPSAAEISSAKHAFEQAVSLEAERRWAEATLKLREAIAVKDTPGLRFHLAHCELEQGHLVEAAQEYERVSELLRQGASAPDVQKLLGPASAALERRIPRLTVELPADLEMPSTALDGKPFPPSELALGVPLNPGHHTLRVSAHGREPLERALLLKEGEPVTVRPELLVSAPAAAPAAAPSAAAVPSAPSAEPPPPDRGRSSAKVYLMIGESVLTAAGLAVGIGYRFSASSASDRIVTAQQAIDSAAPGDETACGRAASSPVCANLQSAIDDHDRALVISDVGFITAGVGAAALVTTWLVYPSASSESSGLSVQPSAGLGRVGLIGRF